MNKEVFFWNGETCKAEFVNVRINPMETDKLAWWKPLENTIRRAILITSNGCEFLIDNEDGLGYHKITVGRGMWRFGSRHLDGANIEVVGDTPPADIVRVFSQSDYDATEQQYNDYWMEHRPNDLRRLNQLKAMAQGAAPIFKPGTK